jgi:hypothetical protein
MTSPENPDIPRLEEPLPENITFQARDGVLEITQLRSIGWGLAFLPVASFSGACLMQKPCAIRKLRRDIRGA